ncbi:MAG: hypothetical protein HOP13_17825 [Alphaproteobacteria bacterium]|jgi:phosphate-selective porin OprO/OprP|nr:hypothetical protein [Alphaproteobacteria bacterium]
MRNALLAASALYAVAVLPVQAGEKENLKAQIEALKQQIAAQQKQLDELSTQVQDVKVSTVNQFAGEGPKLAIKDARPTYTSGDGKSSISLRGRLSLDYANYFQGRAGPLATDFRRGSFASIARA